jgi:hypothetical protein
MTIVAFLATGLLLAWFMLARRCKTDASVSLPSPSLPQPFPLMAVPTGLEGETTIIDIFARARTLLKIWTEKRRSEVRLFALNLPPFAPLPHRLYPDIVVEA